MNVTIIASIVYKNFKFGIGADGLIFSEKCESSSKYDFIMHFYNNDGKKEKFCGNGAR